MPGLKKLFGRNLRRLRLRSGLSQERLAEALGLTCHSVSNLERGIHAPRFKTLERLTQIFGVSAETFFAVPLKLPASELPRNVDRQGQGTD